MRPLKPKLSVAFIILCHFISFAFGFGQTSSDSTHIAAVPLSAIATQSANDYEMVFDQLESIVQSDVAWIQEPHIDTIEFKVGKLKALSDQLMEENMPISFYESLILRWTKIDEEITGPENTLSDYSLKLEKLGRSYAVLSAKWEMTKESDLIQNAPQDVSIRVNDILHLIDSANVILKDSLKKSISLQNMTTDLRLLSTNYIKNLNDLKQLEISSLLTKQDPPIWKAVAEKDSLSTAGDKKTILHFGKEDSKAYLKSEWPKLIALLLLLGASLLFFNWLKEKAEDSNAMEAISVLNKPWLASLIFFMLLALWILPERPLLMNEAFALVFMVPFIFLYKHIAPKEARWMLGYLYLIFLLSTLVDFFINSPLTLRLSNLIEIIAAAIIILHFIRKKQSMKSQETADLLWFKLVNYIAPILLLVCLAAFFSNLLGYYNIAVLLNRGVFVSLALSIILGISFFSIRTSLTSFLKTNAAEQSLLVKNKKELILKWLTRNLRAAAILLWLYHSLKGFHLWNALKSAVLSIGEIGHNFGSLYLSIGNLVGFILIVYLSWLTSYIIKMLLEIEVFGRFNLPRGVPMAISSLTQYFLVITGFMMAMSYAGFDLKNLSLLAGALGVGIGFGLQNTVNNFISGLILAFERPVTVGDIVNVAGHEGEVIKIGIRSSTIKQWDGSQVIVPNADLISNKVINWTILKYQRRLILNIQTRIDSRTSQILGILKQAAEEVEYILRDPEPKAYFQGIKDHKQEFALYYWASGNILDCKSLVNLAVERLMKEAGIKFITPFEVKMEEGISARHEAKPKA